MAHGNFEAALPVTLDAISQAQDLFHHRPVIQMFPLYLLAAQANLGTYERSSFSFSFFLIIFEIWYASGYIVACCTYGFQNVVSCAGANILSNFSRKMFPPKCYRTQALEAVGGFPFPGHPSIGTARGRGNARHAEPAESALRPAIRAEKQTLRGTIFFFFFCNS